MEEPNYTEEQKKMIELNKKYLRDFKQQNVVPKEKDLSIHLLYGMQHVLSKTSRHGFESLKSRPHLLENEGPSRQEQKERDTALMMCQSQNLKHVEPAQPQRVECWPPLGEATLRSDVESPTAEDI